MRSLIIRKAGCFLLALLLSGVYIVGFMPLEVQKFVIARHQLAATDPLASDKFRFGDLYGIAFLSAFRLPYQNHTTITKPIDVDSTRSYSVRILGDSYTNTAKLRTSVFGWADTLTLGGIDDVLKGKSTTFPIGSRSILVLESSERYMRSRFGADADSIAATKAAADAYARLPWLLQQFERIIRGFCRDASTDMEYLVFDYGLFRSIKETRADLTYRWFDRIPEGVGLSADRKRLYLKETLNSTNTGSFTDLDSAEVDRIVDELNRIGQRARQQGYSAVFLSIIPNPVSVIEPNRGHYNHLVERVEQHPALKIGVISLYDRFRIDGGRYYHPSDSHWNQAGIDVWVTTMNQLFNRTARTDAF